MLTSKKERLISLTIAFVIVELVLGILVHTTNGKALKIISFDCVLLACLFACLCYVKSRNYILTQIALACTVCADVLLVLLGTHRTVAMIFFSVTQICYALRIYFNQESKRERVSHIVSRAVVTLIAIVITIIVLKEKTDALSLISLFYYANLIMNIVFAFMQTKKSTIFAIGLLLFAMCDFFIGLSVMADSYLQLSAENLLYKLNDLDFNFAWLFYVPSQACIALSLLKEKTNPTE